MFALEACDHGYQTILLGANMPLDELPAAIKKTESDALILSGVVQPDDKVISEQLPKLAAGLTVPVFLGGAAAASSFDALKKSGIHLIGTDIEAGLKQVSKYVNTD